MEYQKEVHFVGVPTLSSSVFECRQYYCVQDCPRRTIIPDYVDLLKGTGFNDCLTTDFVNIRPGALPPEKSVYFGQGSRCYLTPQTTPSLGDNGAFTITFWIWQEKNNMG